MRALLRFGRPSTQARGSPSGKPWATPVHMRGVGSDTHPEAMGAVGKTSPVLGAQKEKLYDWRCGISGQSPRTRHRDVDSGVPPGAMNVSGVLLCQRERTSELKAAARTLWRKEHGGPCTYLCPKTRVWLGRLQYLGSGRPVSGGRAARSSCMHRPTHHWLAATTNNTEPMKPSVRE